MTNGCQGDWCSSSPTLQLTRHVVDSPRPAIYPSLECLHLVIKTDEGKGERERERERDRKREREREREREP